MIKTNLLNARAIHKKKSNTPFKDWMHYVEEGGKRRREERMSEKDEDDRRQEK